MRLETRWPGRADVAWDWDLTDLVGLEPVIFYLKLKNVSCEYDRWVVETQLCKLRDTLDTLTGRACAMFQLKYGVVNYK